MKKRDNKPFTAKIIGKNLEMAKYNYFQKYGKIPQKEICNQVGIHETQLSHYESGRRVPSLKIFAELCKLYHADPAVVLGVDMLNGKMSTVLENEQQKEHEVATQQPIFNPIIS